MVNYILPVLSKDLNPGASNVSTRILIAIYRLHKVGVFPVRTAIYQTVQSTIPSRSVRK